MLLTDEQYEKAMSRVCLPLDVETLDEARELVRELTEMVGMFKVGKQLFTNEGPAAVEMVHELGGKVFLDLKYHDIPNTLKGTAKAATKLGVYMFNIHASGGTEMMKAALKGVDEGVEQYNTERPKVLGVTVLTSIDDKILNDELRVPGRAPEQVLHLAKLCESVGLDGIVCSAADLYAVRNKLRKDFMYVTPGVKGPRTEAGADQKRVFTPGNAIQDGSSILVVGRAITEPIERGTRGTPEQMRTAAYEILQDMAKYL